MGRKNNEILVIAAFIASLLFSCKKTDDPKKPVPPGNTENKVFVVCEGSYGNGSSSLGIYLTEKDSFYEDVFEAVNGSLLGDVFQSMILLGDRYFLCINNSDKIIVINKADYKIQGTLNVPKPRYILPISDTKAYVSSLFNDKVYIINPQSLQVTGSITLPAQNAEGLTLWNNKVVVSTWDTTNNKVYVIDAATDVIENGITVSGYAPQESLIDKEGMLWVLSGNVTKRKQSKWTRIDLSTGAVIKSYSFPLNADATRPVMNSTKDTIYFLEVNYDGGIANNGVYRMDIHSVDLPQQPFIPAVQYQYYWALGIDPVTGYVFIGDPKGFVQKGNVHIYKQDGTLVKTFKTGVGPGHFYFD